MSNDWDGSVPLLDLVKVGEKRNWNKDDDGFLAMAHFDLYVALSVPVRQKPAFQCSQ